MLAVAQGVALVSPAGVAADDACAAPERLFAVDRDTGHLSELSSCPATGAMAVVAEVDTGDWRYPSRSFAAAAGPVTVLYTVTADGHLQARRQDAPGLPLGPPVEVGANVDWSGTWAISPGPGFVAISGLDVRLFRHVGWDTGGQYVVEGPPLLGHYSEWAGGTGDIDLIGMHGSGRASGYYLNQHWRIWRGSNGWMVAWPSGVINPDIRGVTGAEPTLYGVQWSSGAVVRLTQPRSVEYPDCPGNPESWTEVTSLPGNWSAVVVPERATVAGDWPVIAARPGSASGRASVAAASKPVPPGPLPSRCPPGSDPYKWQK